MASPKTKSKLPEQAKNVRSEYLMLRSLIVERVSREMADFIPSAPKPAPPPSPPATTPNPTTKGKVLKTVTLFLTEGTSDKMYKVWIEQKAGKFQLYTAFGRRSATNPVTSMEAEFTDVSFAERELNKIVNKKKSSKGYTTAVSGIPYSD